MWALSGPSPRPSASLRTGSLRREMGTARRTPPSFPLRRESGLTVYRIVKPDKPNVNVAPRLRGDDGFYAAPLPRGTVRVGSGFGPPPLATQHPVVHADIGHEDAIQDRSSRQGRRPRGYEGPSGGARSQLQTLAAARPRHCTSHGASAIIGHQHGGDGPPCDPPWSARWPSNSR